MQDLTEEERARVTDGKHSIQAASRALSGVDPDKIPKIEEIEECLQSADETLRDILRILPQDPAKRSDKTAKN